MKLYITPILRSDGFWISRVEADYWDAPIALLIGMETREEAIQEAVYYIERKHEGNPYEILDDLDLTLINPSRMRTGAKHKTDPKFDDVTPTHVYKDPIKRIRRNGF